MLSGFIPIKSSVRKLERDPVIERTELSTNHILVYLEKVSIHLGQGWDRNTGTGTFGHISKKIWDSKVPRI
ncbi:hypothetical protein AV530_012332 [Patagioenas fasciata monilis]|uniref:Alpha-macroglobulin receptor-binding domain-containing protein n=1 Tax=Patagioenas fasciata monilis TaxID=372326 RepID=A0A1V4JAX8_PATFA|nr:hypothetical protein AV530_012332 [Patagioenas fasciata monilis]